MSEVTRVTVVIPKNSGKRSNVLPLPEEDHVWLRRHLRLRSVCAKGCLNCNNWSTIKNTCETNMASFPPVQMR